MPASRPERPDPSAPVRAPRSEHPGPSTPVRAPRSEHPDQAPYLLSCPEPERFTRGRGQKPLPVGETVEECDRVTDLPADGIRGRTAIADEHAALLRACQVGRLATVTADGQPHAVPVCYALLAGLLYTPIDEKPKRGDPRSLQRLRNIATNPRVCLVVDVYDSDDWSRLAWLQVRGIATLVEDGAERERAIAALRQRYRQYRTMALEGLPLVRITPTRLVGWRAASARPG
ncbi:MAG: TIGR03668 family PPOX class F420-dependent oxidoreductase [Chloroflexi bacterium]|nr:TIGR03668 family PPOX class F420-dependent oxidoreductase [Chloroflexota bacterium]